MLTNDEKKDTDNIIIDDHSRSPSSLQYHPHPHPHPHHPQHPHHGQGVNDTNDTNDNNSSILVEKGKRKHVHHDHDVRIQPPHETNEEQLNSNNSNNSSSTVNKNKGSSGYSPDIEKLFETFMILKQHNSRIKNVVWGGFSQCETDSDYYYCTLCFKCEPTGNLNVTKGVYKRENGNTSTFRNHYRSRHKEVLDELMKKFDDVQKIKKEEKAPIIEVKGLSSTSPQQPQPTTATTTTTMTMTPLKRKLDLINSPHDNNNNNNNNKYHHLHEQRESIARKKEILARETSIRMDIQKKKLENLKMIMDMGIATNYVDAMMKLGYENLY